MEYLWILVLYKLDGKKSAIYLNSLDVNESIDTSIESLCNLFGEFQRAPSIMMNKKRWRPLTYYARDGEKNSIIFTENGIFHSMLISRILERGRCFPRRNYRIKKAFPKISLYLLIHFIYWKFSRFIYF